MEIELLNPVLAFRGLSDEDQEEVEIADTEEEADLDDDELAGDDDDDEEDDDALITEE